jgi:SAM-dependent methyltransferase
MIAEAAQEKRQLSLAHWAAGRFDEATQHAWAAYRLGPDDQDSKVLLARILHRFWRITGSETRADLIRLLQDRNIDPGDISLAGWFVALRDPPWQGASKCEDFANLAAYVENDELCRILLHESPVYLRPVEHLLTKVRRWLLVSSAWRRYTQLTDALVAQAALNGGAWPFDETERVLLNRESELAIVRAYLPVRDAGLESCANLREYTADRTVAEDYERWPYPVWHRITVRPTRHIRNLFGALDPSGRYSVTGNGTWLVAGCGTGQEPATIASAYPDTEVTAIDVSGASLEYAQRNCATLGISNIRFLKLDLHNVAELGVQFDVISCCGVLHHLPDPEKGWDALVTALRPNGLMRIMLYSRLGYPNVAAEPDLIGHLTNGPVTDDTIRAVRQRLMDRADSKLARTIINSLDFATLAGTRDHVLHTQVHLFDVPRIGRALDKLGLCLASFVLPRPDAVGRYNAMFPHDPLHRDLDSWAKFEATEPGVFKSMYEFWCHKGDA